jgi:hydroxymethylglutaryl-CoA synthase
MMYTRRYDINPKLIGRLEVGTETLIDKSKSTKTVLMDLFQKSGNTDVEGATIVNACYGGTAALLNAFLWCESDDHCCDYNAEYCNNKNSDDSDDDSDDDDDDDDGRRPFAVVIAADIATYARGAARPTCGVGAVAVLVGRNAPLCYNAKHKATHASNVYDFYKPNPATEYPTVDGALSQTCYYQALEDCYTRFCQKMERQQQQQQQQQQQNQQKGSNQDGAEEEEKTLLFDATSADYFVFHSPYNKLVQKSYARLFLLDARRQQEREKKRMQKSEPKGKDMKNGIITTETDTCKGNHPLLLQEWLDKPIEDTYNDKALEKVLQNMSKQDYQQRLSDANAASQVVGNTYTASVFFGLASLMDKQGRQDGDGGGNAGLTLSGKSIVVFSYGSGALATMYRLQV